MYIRQKLQKLEKKKITHRTSSSLCCCFSHILINTTRRIWCLNYQIQFVSYSGSGHFSEPFQFFSSSFFISLQSQIKKAKTRNLKQKNWKKSWTLFIVNNVILLVSCFSLDKKRKCFLFLVDFKFKFLLINCNTRHFKCLWNELTIPFCHLKSMCLCVRACLCLSLVRFFFCLSKSVFIWKLLPYVELIFPVLHIYRFDFL